MKILLVNNNTRHLQALSQSLIGHDVQIIQYQPGVEFDHQDKDLVILSGGGGEGQEISDTYHKDKLWYEDEMNFALSCDKPMIGICMGFEVIASAYGSKVEQMPGLVSGVKQVYSSKPGLKNSLSRQLEQFESHSWRVTETPKGFEVLADSAIGLEIIKHKNRPIFATQFHPEKGGTLRIKELIKTIA